MKLRIITSVTLVAFVLSRNRRLTFHPIEVKASHVAKNIYCLPASGGNIGVSVGPDGILIVDDQVRAVGGKNRR